MRVLVCGDRNWTDGEYIETRLETEVPLPYADHTIIDGAARGADTLGHIAARNLGMGFVRFPAKWAEFGRAAGPIRNQQMLDEGKPDLVLAFHDDIEHSKGTADMVRRAHKAGIRIEICHH